MGTNYYLRAIDKPSMHVGKSSCGWKFAFQIDGIDSLHMRGLENTRKNAYKVIQYYLDNGYELFDEYGEKVPLKDFIRLVDSKADEDEHYEDGEVVRDEVVSDGARWISTWFC